MDFSSDTPNIELPLETTITKIITRSGLQILIPNMDPEFIGQKLDRGEVFTASGVVMSSHWSNPMENGLIDPTHIEVVYPVRQQAISNFKIRQKLRRIIDGEEIE